MDAVIEYLQGKYGQFQPGYLNPEGKDCNKQDNRRGVSEFVDLSDKVASLTNSLDDYLYVMNSVLLGLRTSGDLGVVVSAGTSGSWRTAFCIGSVGLSPEYDDLTPNQISTHIWSFIATSASSADPTTQFTTLIGLGGNILHDPVEAFVSLVTRRKGYEGASWQDYLASITGLVLGQRLRFGQITTEQFGTKFSEAFALEASYWEYMGCSVCKDIFGPYASQWAESAFPICPGGSCLEFPPQAQR